jgi:hypothetical protein
MKYRVYFTATITGSHVVEADSEEDAMEKLEKETSFWDISMDRDNQTLDVSDLTADDCDELKES